MNIRTFAPLSLNEPVGWIGLGAMGVPMAQRLANAGFPLFLFNRTRKDWTGVGTAAICSSPCDVAVHCRIVFVMVTDGSASKTIFSGPNGLLDADLNGRIIINMTTERPAEAIAESGAVLLAGGSYHDIPVSGSVIPAQKGELLLLAGGDPRLGEVLAPLLNVLSREVCWMGPVGSGMKTKLVLNALLAAHMESLAETLLLAESLGLASDDMARVILDSPLSTAFSRIKVNNILTGDYSKAFSVALMSKDLSLLASECRDQDQLLAPLFSALNEAYRNLVDNGAGNMDLSVLYDERKKRRSGTQKQSLP